MKPVLKLVLIGVLLLVLGVPVMMLQGLNGERQQRGREVAADIANSSSRAQIVIGPLLRIEIERSLRKRRMVGEGATLRSEEEIVRERVTQLLTPTRLDIDAEMSSETRQRGLFEARVYDVDMQVAAQFAEPTLPAASEDVVEQRIVSAALVLGLGDARGVRAVQATLGGVALQPEPGSGLAWNTAGLQLPLSTPMWEAPLDLKLDLDLIGTESLHWLPVGDATEVTLRGDWPHPSFVGQFLSTHREVGSADARPEPARPTHREVGDIDTSSDAPLSEASGFSAEWRVSRLAAQAPQAVRECGVAAASCAAASGTGFGLRLLDPVDRYLKTERAIKYAWLFIVLVFGALFFLELLRPVRVHPLQYGLTGLALALFFLLLLSLSEHIGFGLAYVLAAAACVGLVATYMAAPLGSRSRAAGFGALLAALYGLLYGLLQSEDYALLMGALALFALLATAMLLTRRLDWYRLGEARAE